MYTLNIYGGACLLSSLDECRQWGGEIHIWYTLFSCFDLVHLYLSTCEPKFRKGRDGFNLINNSSHGMTNLFLIGLEHSIWLAAVAKQHKNNGATLTLQILNYFHLRLVSACTCL